MKIVYLALFVLSVPYCAVVAEPIDRSNSPARVSVSRRVLESRLDFLPKEAHLDAWFFDDNFHFTDEGLARRDGTDLSPIEKYDAVFHTGFPATAWEKSHHGTDAGRLKPESWFGHCHGIAAAITLAPEPLFPVTHQGIVFSVRDLKALLGEAFYRPESGMAGLRCNAKTIERDKSGRALDAACRDLNAGSFHVAVANFVGRLKQKPIIDMYLGAEVWSAPIMGFRVEALDALSVSDANRLLMVQGNTYQYNVNATKLVLVRIAIHYAYKFEQVRKYDYILELDAKGEVIGGEWVDQSMIDHPDFIWLPSAPGAENPFVGPVNILNLVNASQKR